MDKETLEEAVKEVADMFLEDVIRKGKLRKHMGLLPTFREHWAVLKPRLLTLYSSSREKEVLLQSNNKDGLALLATDQTSSIQTEAKKTGRKTFPL